MESFDSSTKIPKMILYFSSRALSLYELSLENAYQESLVRRCMITSLTIFHLCPLLKCSREKIIKQRNIGVETLKDGGRREQFMYWKLSFLTIYGISRFYFTQELTKCLSFSIIIPSFQKETYSTHLSFYIAKLFTISWV